MARYRKREPIDYNELYYFYCHNPLDLREISSLRFDAESGQPRWSTVADTRCGMCLHRPPLHTYTYHATPINTVTFAYTGGDGCHFGFLTTDGEWSEDSPVVMTYPPFSGKNVIVAGSLFEFLRLGLRTGFFALEELAHYDEPFDRGHPFVVGHLTSRRKSFWLDDEKADAVAQLAKEFRLTPLRRIGPRLAALNRRYLPQLVCKEP